MTAHNQTLLDSLAKIIPSLTPLQKKELLSYGEGMAASNREQEQQANHLPPADENEKP